MKYNTKKTQRNFASRFCAFAAVLGLGLTALFASTASAEPFEEVNTDPVISVNGTCELWGPDTPSGITMQIINNDSWDETYVIGVFNGWYEDTGDIILDEPDVVSEEEIPGASLAGSSIVIDAFFATVQVLHVDENPAGDLVFHQTLPVCIPELNFPIPGEEDEEDDGLPDLPDFNFDFIPEMPEGPQAPDFDFGIPDFNFGNQENEDNEDNENEGDEEAPVEVDDDNNSGQEAPVEVDDDNNSGQEAPVEVVDEGNAPIIVWENTTNDSSVDNNDSNTPVIEEIGKPAKPKIDPEDPKDVGDSDEIASSEGKGSQGKSGLSILWIILIIVGGITTVGTTTRAIQKNNN